MRCVFVDGGDMEDVHLTCAGRDYLAVNLKQRNPVDWERIIMTITIISTIAFSLIAAAFSVALLFRLLVD